MRPLAAHPGTTYYSEQSRGAGQLVNFESSTMGIAFATTYAVMALLLSGSGGARRSGAGCKESRGDLVCVGDSLRDDIKNYRGLFVK